MRQCLVSGPLILMKKEESDISNFTALAKLLSLRNFATQKYRCDAGYM